MITHLKLSARQKQALLVIGDAIIVFAAFSMAYIFRIAVYEGRSASIFWERVSWLLPLAILLHILVFYVFELYDIEVRRSDTRRFLWLTLSVSTATFLIVFASYILPQHRMGRVLVSVHVPLLIIILFFWRKLFFTLIQREPFKKNLVVLDMGSLNLETKTIDELREGLKLDYNWIGVASVQKSNPGLVTLDEIQYPSIEALVEKRGVKAIVLSKNPKEAPALKNRLIDFKFKGIEIFDLPTLHQILLRKIPVLNIKGSYFLFSHQDRSFQPFFYLKMKRVFDIALALTGLVLSFPFFLMAVAAIRCSSKGPVFFRQERLGVNEKPFTLIKFRTMVEDAEKDSGPQWSSKDDPRITKVGRLLRKTRTDEIPQLLNVLKGEMSFVGPRPIRKHFADVFTQYIPLYRLRFSVKPGLTGWAQVKGDYGSDVEGQLKKLEYELFYIQNRSTFFDLFILLKTIQTVLLTRGE